MKNKKILFIFLLSLLFVFFTYSVFADGVTSSTSLKGVDYNFPNFSSLLDNTYSTSIVYKRDDGLIFLFVCKVSNAFSSGSLKYPYIRINSSTYDIYVDGCKRYKLNGSSWTFDKSYSTVYFSGSDIIYADDNVTDMDGNVLFPKVIEKKCPEITTSEEDLTNLNFEYLTINSNDYSDSDFYLLTYDRTNVNTETLDGLYPKKEILLSNKSTYYIPKSELGITFKDAGTYAFRFATRELVDNSGSLDGSSGSGSGGGFKDEQDWYYSYIGEDFYFTVGGDVSQRKIYEANRQKELEEQERQTQAIKDNTETNKNIFQKIGDILSYINPFSENFFGRKIVEFIIDGLKGLFIPEDGFFDNFFTNLKDWFSTRFGFLFYPFELILDVLNRMLSINLGEPAFTIPNIIEPSTGQTLIVERSYNLNSILENNSFKTLHDIYLVIVDAIIIFGLVNLTKRKLEEVETK